MWKPALSNDSVFSRGYAKRSNDYCYEAKYANVSLTQM